MQVFFIDDYIKATVTKLHGATDTKIDRISFRIKSLACVVFKYMIPHLLN